MTLKTRFLAAAAALSLPAIAAAQPPMTPPASTPPETQPSTTTPAVATTTPPTQQSQDATETQAQQPDAAADGLPAQQTAQTPPPATTPDVATQPAPAANAQAQATAPGTPAATAAVRAATAADLRTGVQVHDQQGALVGTVESADAASAVVSTGTARGRLALASFGVNGQGLVIAMTKAQLEAAVAAARPS